MLKIKQYKSNTDPMPPSTVDFSEYHSAFSPQTLTASENLFNDTHKMLADIHERKEDSVHQINQIFENANTDDAEYAKKFAKKNEILQKIVDDIKKLTDLIQPNAAGVSPLTLPKSEFAQMMKDAKFDTSIQSDLANEYYSSVLLNKDGSVNFDKVKELMAKDPSAVTAGELAALAILYRSALKKDVNDKYVVDTDKLQDLINCGFIWNNNGDDIMGYAGTVNISPVFEAVTSLMVQTSDNMAKANGDILCDDANQTPYKQALIGELDIASIMKATALNNQQEMTWGTYGNVLDPHVINTKIYITPQKGSDNILTSYRVSDNLPPFDDPDASIIYSFKTNCDTACDANDILSWKSVQKNIPADLTSTVAEAVASAAIGTVIAVTVPVAGIAIDIALAAVETGSFAVADCMNAYSSDESVNIKARAAIDEISLKEVLKACRIGGNICYNGTTTIILNGVCDMNPDKESDSLPVILSKFEQIQGNPYLTIEIIKEQLAYYLNHGDY